MRLVPAVLLCFSSLSANAGGPPSCAQPVRFSAAWLTDPPVDHSKAAAELDDAAPAARGRGTPLGHVVVTTRLSVEPQPSCNGLTVRLDFVQPVLRIARELPADSCSYALVMAHEQTHVRIHQEIARQFRALHYPWPASATRDAVLVFAKQQLARLMDAQRQFDSPQEYARSRTACGGEVVQRLGASPPPPRTP